MQKIGLFFVTIVVIGALFVKAGDNPIGAATVAFVTVCTLIRAARRE